MRIRAGLSVVLAGVVAATALALGTGGAGAVQSGASLVVSTREDRGGAVPLDGASVTGTVWITAVTTGIDGVVAVDFHLDNLPPATPTRTENTAPYDFGGGTSEAPRGWRASSVAAGGHTLTAVVRTTTGERRLTASFTTGPGGGTPSPSPSSTSSSPTTSTPTATTTPAPTTATSTVTPSPTRTTGTATSGTTTTGTTGGPAGHDPLVRLSWTGDAATSVTVTWAAATRDVPAEVRVRPRGSDTWTTVAGTLAPTGTQRTALLTGLAPDREYEYQVRVDGGWSPVASARTVGPDSPVTAVYLADTGIAGRADGLADGTPTVISRVAALDPHLVLGGGDYAYYNSDKRWPTLDGAIDAWLAQMQPVLRDTAFMPAYGNHEVLLGEGFDPWADRFATPRGVAGKSSSVDDRGTYSFDVGPVHFVAINVVDETAGLPTAMRRWIETDITAAQRAGARWVVPFFHGVPVGDGTNHRTNYALQAQLGPLFERLGVPLVLFSHDQSFERTYPLTGLRDTRASSPVRTSTATGCYTDADGVVWVKTSPAGKRSNKNRGFSPFLTHPAPPWTAVRSNSRFHVLELTATPTSLAVTVHGILPGTPDQVVDSFVIRSPGGC